MLVPIEYEGSTFEEPLKLNVFVDDCLMVELKAVTEVLPIHGAQLPSYTKLKDVPLGPLISFPAIRPVNGVHRFILPEADGSTEASREL